MINVILQNDLNRLKIPTAKQFQQWVDTVFQQVDDVIPYTIQEVCIRIVDKKESAILNKTFRQKEGPTNVLSFPNEADEHIDDHSLGDIAICADLVEFEAQKQAIPTLHHWAHLSIHGVLHLLGYDHIEQKDAVTMESLEIKILKILNIKNPYTECSLNED